MAEAYELTSNYTIIDLDGCSLAVPRNGHDGRPMILRGTAFRIMSMVRMNMNVDSIVNRLVSDTSAPIGQVDSDVRQFLQNLEEEGLVRPVL